MERGAHAIIATTDGDVLLVQKADEYVYDKNNAGKVSMFGGRVEESEEPKEALRRELQEELGLEAGTSELAELGVYKKTEEIDGVDVEVHVFILRGVDPTAISLLGDKESDRDKDMSKTILQAKAKDMLMRKDLTRITRLALQDYLSRGL